MHISTTDGKEYLIPDQCPYCNMDTAGQHEWQCPFFNSRGQLYSQITIVYPYRTNTISDENYTKIPNTYTMGDWFTPFEFWGNPRDDEWNESGGLSA